jgi:Na+/H+-translocating membrane pyrophosphatase
MGKGFAIGSAALTALALFSAYTQAVAVGRGGADRSTVAIGAAAAAGRRRRGMFTGMVALAAIFLMMILIYRLAGVNATFCLLLRSYN